jgi:hypothetical protein
LVHVSAFSAPPMDDNEHMEILDTSKIVMKTLKKYIAHTGHEPHLVHIEQRDHFKIIIRLAAKKHPNWIAYSESIVFSMLDPEDIDYGYRFQIIAYPYKDVMMYCFPKHWRIIGEDALKFAEILGNQDIMCITNGSPMIAKQGSDSDSA